MWCIIVVINCYWANAHDPALETQIPSSSNAARASSLNLFDKHEFSSAHWVTVFNDTKKSRSSKQSVISLVSSCIWWKVNYCKSIPITTINIGVFQNSMSINFITGFEAMMWPTPSPMEPTDESVHHGSLLGEDLEHFTLSAFQLRELKEKAGEAVGVRLVWRPSKFYLQRLETCTNQYSLQNIK